MKKQTTKYIDENTRVKVKFHFPALDTVICLQRRKKRFWRTVSWFCPSFLRDCDFEGVVRILERQESAYKIRKSEFKRGIELLNKDKKS